MKKLTLFLLLLFGVSTNAQTTLSAGHIAIIGWFSDGVDGGTPQYNDGFTFILLRDLSAGTVIYFTDNGWSDAGWVNSASELHVSWTVPSGGLSTGTIVYVYETSSFNNGIASVGTLSTLLYGTTWHWASSGDQILAYQGSGARTSSPTFIAALDADYNSSFDLSNGWSSGTVGAGYEETFCSVPTGLTNGTNCVALFNSVQGEIWDNCKYNGTLTGTASSILSAINNYTNWTGSDIAPYDISASAFPTPAITDPLPVELTLFTAAINNDNVQLTWQTATEVNNYGFEVERASTSLGMNWEKIGFVNGAGNSNSPKEYMFVDQEYEQEQDGVVKYRLKQIDNDGRYQYSKEVEVEVSSSRDFSLGQNYPNPFNPSTVISLQLAASGHVSLKVYDVIGNEVAVLINEFKEAGTHEVEFKSAVGNRQLASGIYFYKINSGKYSELKKMILLR
ncbi:MAG: T9SS type A sorting domain-containing protein [Ignavibacteriaceae bacterium]|jgi:hypothetical protein|nr:T9SS type A sorting domain-containing protein [Ignavibacteriaceae bacterium]